MNKADSDTLYEENLLSWLRADDRIMTQNLAKELGISEAQVVHEALLLLANTHKDRFLRGN